MSGRALHRHDAVDDLEVLLVDLERLGGDPAAPSPWPACAARWIAEPLITAAREANVPTAYGIRRVSPVTTSTSSNRTPSSSATSCAKTVAWPWPWVVRPVATLTLPEVSMWTCAPS